jgi:quercetin dioxygenase-like cupin family protein
MAAKEKTSSRQGHGQRKRGLPGFTVSHKNEDDFKVGLRSYANYRDLGVSEATSGKVQAHVIRMLPPFEAAVVSKRHYHDTEFQMVYVLKGWQKVEIDGEEHVMREGSAWTQPPKVRHTVVGYSDDCELLEIIIPANFDTVEV